MKRQRKLWIGFILITLLALTAISVQAQVSHYGGFRDVEVPVTQNEPAVAEPAAPSETGSADASAEEEPSSGNYSEAFDKDFWDQGWVARTLIGNPNGDYFVMGPKRLSFKLPFTEVYEYLTNDQTAHTDALVEATFENIRSNEASYGVICRYNDLGWYELRVNIAGPLQGSYAIYKYDQILKNNGQVPYVRLHPNMIQYFTSDLKLGMNVRNKLGLDCTGNKIRVFINDKEQVASLNAPIIDNQFADGVGGVMVESYGKGTVDIDFVGFTVTVP